MSTDTIAAPDLPVPYPGPDLARVMPDGGWERLDGVDRALLPIDPQDLGYPCLKPARAPYMEWACSALAGKHDWCYAGNGHVVLAVWRSR